MHFCSVSLKSSHATSTTFESKLSPRKELKFKTFHTFHKNSKLSKLSRSAFQNFPNFPQSYFLLSMACFDDKTLFLVFLSPFGCFPVSSRQFLPCAASRHRESNLSCVRAHRAPLSLTLSLALSLSLSPLCFLSFSRSHVPSLLSCFSRCHALRSRLCVECIHGAAVPSVVVVHALARASRSCDPFFVRRREEIGRMSPVVDRGSHPSLHQHTPRTGLARARQSLPSFANSKKQCGHCRNVCRRIRHAR